MSSCSSNQFYDPNRGCVDLRCPKGSKASRGTCSKTENQHKQGITDRINDTTNGSIGITNKINDTTNGSIEITDRINDTTNGSIGINTCITKTVNNCRLVTLVNESEYMYLNACVVLYKGKLFDVFAFDNKSRPVVCVQLIDKVRGSVTKLRFPPGIAELTYVGCGLSITASILIIITYTFFTELRTLPSMLLVSLAAVFIFGDLFLLASGVVSQTISSVEICSFIGILLHFLFLCRFTWMNCLGMEYTRTFLLAVKMETKTGKPTQIRLFLFYNLIGWGVPLLITTITVIINYTVKGAVRYGTDKDGTRGLCWINNMTALLIAFVIPVLVSSVFNCIFFVAVVVLICIASQTSVKDLKRNHVRVVLGIFAVLGVTWMLGLMAILSTKPWAWYPFTIVNTNQAIVIAITFLATKKILLLYWSVISCKRSIKYTKVSQK